MIVGLTIEAVAEALALAGSVSDRLPHLAALARSWEQLAADGKGDADCSILFTLRS